MTNLNSLLPEKVLREIKPRLKGRLRREYPDFEIKSEDFEVVAIEHALSCLIIKANFRGRYPDCPYYDETDYDTETSWARSYL